MGRYVYLAMIVLTVAAAVIVTVAAVYELVMQ